MSVLDRKLRRDLYAYKGLLAAIVMIITIGVGGFVQFLSVHTNLEAARRSYYAQCRMADFWVSIEKFPLSELDRLRLIQGISALRSRIRQRVTVDLEGIDKPVTGLVLSLPEEPQPVINDIVLKSGGYFTDLRRQEVIVNDAFARTHNIRPGDRVRLLLKGRRLTLFVVGTAISSEYVYAVPPGSLLPDASSYGIFYLKRQFLAETLDFQGAANEIVGVLSAEVADHPDPVLQNVKAMLRPFGEATATPLDKQLSHFALSAEIYQLKNNAFILPPIFLLVAASILNLLMLRIAEQQRTVVGTLKAIGYSNVRLFLHFISFGIVIGTLGGLLGSLLGHVLGVLNTSIYEGLFEFPGLVHRAYPSLYLPCILLSVLVAIVGSIRGAGVVVRLVPADAMRPKPPPTAQKILLERFQLFWRCLDFRWQLVLRNVFRQRLRTITGVLTAAVGSMLILTTLQLVDGMRELIAFTYDKLLVSDFELTLQSECDYGALLDSRRLPSVDHAEPVFTLACTFRNGHRERDGAVTGILPTARLTVPRDESGDRVRLPDQGLVMTRELANRLYLSAGDPVTVVPLKGQRQSLRVPVSTIVESFMGTAAYANFYYLNALVGEEESVTGVQLKTNPDPTVAREFYRALKDMPQLQGFSTVRDEKEHLKTFLTPFYVSVVLLILFAGLIFMGSLLNASLISIAERQQEIATLRVIGYRTAEISGIFLRESFCVNAVGILLGLPLGYWLSYGIGHAAATEMVRFPFVIQPASWAWTVILGVSFSLLAHWPVQRVVKKMKWLDALNVKE